MPPTSLPAAVFRAARRSAIGQPARPSMRLAPFAELGLDEPTLLTMLDEHRLSAVPRLQRLWDYYRNAEGPEGLAQHAGLPERLRRSLGQPNAPEIVIENDIAWRIDALVDFAFGKPVEIESAAEDPDDARRITHALRATLQANHARALFQDMGLLGFVHGFVDLLVRAEPLFEAVERGSAAATTMSDDRLAALASTIRIELLDATRSIPLLDEGDYRALRGHIAVWHAADAAPPRPTLAQGVLDALRARAEDRPPRATRSASGSAAGPSARFLEIRSHRTIQRYRGGALTHEWPNRLGVVPVVHIQNASQPYRYAGLSDVEPLIPLQNELNTRLSDRAHRVTMQSFKMFLAKGIDGFDRSPIAPGQVWVADDPHATIESFGGDAHSPSEEAHIQEVRDALDKASGVSPVVLGVIRERLGHLSSENALRLTLMGVLSKTARKRTAYGAGIQRVCELILRALDAAGVLSTTPEQRRVRLRWPDPLPLDERDRLNAALLKRDLGVPTTTLLGELGYEP